MKNFKELELIEPLQRALAEENYETPTPIQAQTIPAALDDRDVLGCAQTGTGKTAAFALPILNRLGSRNLKAKPNYPQVLVLAPTRELAIQIGESFKTYGRHLRLRTVLVYGGVKQGSQVRSLDHGAHVLVATPGRLLDLMNQGYIHLGQLEVFVLDEADRMLDMGFLPDLKRIIRELPKQRQSLFFSATMPPKITQLSQQLLDRPVSVNVTPKETSVERIEQQVVFVDRGAKQDLLREVLSGSEVDRAIVFTRTKRGANVVAQKLERAGLRAAAIHGNKSQNARQKALEAFRRKQVQVLVATDVAARGIDIDGVTHVVNYDMPVEAESYVHRIGRTGRAGAEGLAISFCTPDERGELRDIERLIGIKIPLAPGTIEPPAPIQPSRSAGGSSRSGGQRRSGGGGRNRRSGQSSSRSNSSTSNRSRSAKPGGARRATSNTSSSEGATAQQAAAQPARRPRPGKNARQRSRQTSD